MSLNHLAVATALPAGRVWGTPIEREVRRRIQISVFAYAYEIADQPLVDDYDFDRLATAINKRQGTCHPVLDEFFLTQFSPMTGMWIHNHPDLAGIKRTFDRYWAACGNMFPKRRG
jgi:hypothetical protein